MKRLALITSLIIISISVFGQNQPSRADYFNGFQRTKDKYPDSAIAYLHKLAATDTNATQEVLHNSFAQSFLGFMDEKMRTDTNFLARIEQLNMTLDSVMTLRKANKKVAYLLLDRLSNDPDPFITSNVYPIAKWVEAQEHSGSPNKLLTIGNDYFKYLASSPDFFSARKARYGLLIAKLMVGDKALRATSDELLQLIYTNFQAYLADGGPAMPDWRAQEKRAYYRYMFAYTNFISAQHAGQNKEEKVAFLKLANQYSPDSFDKSVAHAYFYDMIFLFGEEKKSFEEDYLAALGNDEEKFSLLMAMSMNDPAFKAKAKALSKDKAKFDVSWLNKFNETFKPAPSILLKQLDGTMFKLARKNNQWTLVDFWGTWCAPCREEHPGLQKLYRRTQGGDLADLKIITIASNDREEQVKAYMQEFKYSFPVAMSDSQIEKAYNVSSWPSKFLISPQGKFVVIPFNVNFKEYIEGYIN